MADQTKEQIRKLVEEKIWAELQIAIVDIRLLLNDASSRLVKLQLSLHGYEIIRSENKDDL